MDPGWYPDPNSPGRERYWNGVGWIRSDNPKDPAAGSNGSAPKPVKPSRWRLPHSPVPRPVVAIIAVTLVVVSLIALLTGGDDDEPAVTADGRPVAPAEADVLAAVQAVFTDNGLTCTPDGAFLQRPVYLADRLPGLGSLMAWSDEQSAAARRLAADLNALSTVETYPLRQINCGDDSTFRALGGLVVTSPTTDGERLPVLVYTSSFNQLQPQLADAGALVVYVEADRDGPRTSACPTERRTIENALSATSSARGAYPDSLAEMVGRPPDQPLQSDPSARWAYDVADPLALAGKQACDGY